MSKAKSIISLVESVSINEAGPKIGNRTLASDSDRKKYAGLKKSIDDLEKKKSAINAQWEKEQDDKKRVALYDQKSKIRDQIEPLEKQRKGMLSKFRGIQSRPKT